MCGIAAIASAISESVRDRQNRIDAALDSLGNRGPDGRGTWTSPCGLFTLGHTRLAIIDLSTAAAQPMTNEDGTLVVTFNGEVYNAPELRNELLRAGHIFRSRSDTETIVHGLEEWGLDDLLDRLRGMFAFIAWNERTRELFGAVDHAGIKPLFWAERNGTLFAASTCDALLPLLPDSPDLNPTALCHILCHGYCPAPETIWNDVFKLPPGSAFAWTAATGMQVRSWWSPAEAARRAISNPSNASDFSDLLTSTVKRHLLSDVPLGLLLSAGLDSTSIAAALADSQADVSCLTLAMHGTDDESSDAREVCRTLNLQHSTAALAEFDIELLIQRAVLAADEPQAFGSLLTMETVARTARTHSKVFLSGDGGDEAFGGYTWHSDPLHVFKFEQSSPRTRQLAHLTASPEAPGDIRRNALIELAQLSESHAYQQRIFPRFHPAEAAALFAPLGAEYDESTYITPFTNHDAPDLPWPRRAQVLDLNGFCAGHVLPKVDRCCMAHGLEVRPIYLDRDLLEWSLALPVDRASQPKQPIREWLNGRVPDQILRRPKQGFSLRASAPKDEATLVRLISESPMAHHGVLHHSWQGFVAADAPSRRARLFALAMIAQWHQSRVSHLRATTNFASTPKSRYTYAT